MTAAVLRNVATGIEAVRSVGETGRCALDAS